LADALKASHDDVETLNKFSVSECRNKCAVASDVDNPDKHVENTMAAVAKWQAEHKKGS
jgi:hypothetical protein